MNDELPEFWLSVTYVRARRAIKDNPLSRHDGSVKRGAIGSVEDIADGLLWVEFDGQVIPCEPDDVRPFIYV